MKTNMITIMIVVGLLACQVAAQDCPYDPTTEGSPCSASECAAGFESGTCQSYVSAYCSGPGAGDSGCHGGTTGGTAGGGGEVSCPCPYADAEGSPCRNAVCDDHSASHNDSLCWEAQVGWCTGAGASSDAYCAYQAHSCGCPYDDSSESPCNNPACAGGESHDADACVSAVLSWCNDNSTDPACDSCPLNAFIPGSPCSPTVDVCDDAETAEQQAACGTYVLQHCSSDGASDEFCEWLFSGTTTPDCAPMADPRNCSDDHGGSGSDDCSYTLDVPENPCYQTVCHSDDGSLSDACRQVIVTYCAEGGVGANDPGCDEFDGTGGGSGGEDCGCPYADVEGSPCRNEVCDDHSTSHNDTLCWEAQVDWCLGQGSSEEYCQYLAHDTCGCIYDDTATNSPCNNPACAAGESHDATACVTAAFSYCDDNTMDPACDDYCPFGRLLPGSVCSPAVDVCDDAETPEQQASCISYIVEWCSSSDGASDGFCQWIISGATTPDCEPARDPRNCSDGGDGPGSDDCPFSLENTASPCFADVCQNGGGDNPACIEYARGYCAPDGPGFDDPGCDVLDGDGDDCPFSSAPGSPCSASECVDAGDDPSPECLAVVFSWCSGEGSDDPGCEDILGDCPFKSLTLSNPCFNPSCQVPDGEDPPQECLDYVTSWCDDPEHNSDPGCATRGNNCCPYYSSNETNPCLQDVCTGGRNGTDHDDVACNEYQITWCQDKRDSEPFCRWLARDTCGCPYSKVDSDSPCYNDHCQPSDDYVPRACADAVISWCNSDLGQSDPACNNCPFSQASTSTPCLACHNESSSTISDTCFNSISSFCSSSSSDGFCTWLTTGESLGFGCSHTPEPRRSDCDSGNDDFPPCPFTTCNTTLYEDCLNCLLLDDCEDDDRDTCFPLLGQICDADPTHPLCRDTSAPNFCGCPFREDLASNPCKSEKCTGFLATPTSCAAAVFDHCHDHSDEDPACDNCNLLFSYELGSPCLSDTCSTNDSSARPDDFDACVSDITSFCSPRTQTLTMCSLLMNQATLPPCDGGGSDFCPFNNPDHPDNPCNSDSCQARDTATGDVVDIDFSKSGCLLSVQRWCTEIDAGKTDPICFSNNQCGCNIGSSSASPCSPTGSCLGDDATAASCIAKTVRFCDSFDCCPFDLRPGNPCYTDACTVDGIEDAPENCLALTRSFCNNNPDQAYCSVIFEQTVVPCDGTGGGGDFCRIGRLEFPATSAPCTSTACANASSEISDACEADILSYCIESQDPLCFDLASTFPPAAPQIGDVDQFIGADGELIVVVVIKTVFFPEVHNYTFQYKTGDNEYTSVDADGSGQVFLEGQLEVGTTYTVRAIANNGQGSSDPGDSFTFETISGPPDPPQNLRRVAENPDEPCCVTLAWDPPAQDPLGYICLLLDDFVSEFDPNADDSEEPSYFPITEFLPSTQTQVRIELPPAQYDYNLTCVSFNDVGISAHAGSIVETAGESTPPTVRGHLIAHYFDTPEGDIVALDTSDDFDIRSPVPLTAIELWRCNATRANNAIESTCGSFSDSSFDLIHSFPLDDEDEDDFVDTDLDAGQLYVYVARFTNRYGSAHSGISNAVGIPASAPEGDSTAFSIDRMTRTSIRVCWDISTFESDAAEPIKAINVVRYGVSGNEGSYTFTFRKSNIFSPSATCTTLFVIDEDLIALQLVVITESLLYSEPGTDQDDYFVIDHIATELTVRSALASGSGDGTSAFEVGDKITVGFSEATNEPTITSGVTVTGSDATWTFSWSSSTRLVMTVSAVGSNSPSIGTSELVITTDAGIKPADSPSYLVAATARARLNGNWGVDSEVTIPFEIGQTSFTTLEDQPVSLSGLLTNLDSSVVVTMVFASDDGTFSQTTTLAPNFPTFTPSLNFNGVATFTATITASSLTQTVSGTVVVEAVNDAPVISASILPNPTYLSSITYSTPFAFQGSSELVTDPDSNAEEESETLTCTIRMVGAAMKLNASDIDYDGTAPTIEANTAGTTLRFTVDANGVDAVMSEVEVRASSGVAVVQVLLACIDQGGLQAVGRLVMTVNNDQATDCSQVAAAQMTTAMFSDSGSFIMVSFDADIPASVSQSIGCDVLDATTRAALGDFAICFWSAAVIGGEVRRGLQIFADLDASIVPGDTITMATDNDLVRCTGGSPATGSATLQRSPSYVPPTLQLYGPTSLDVCQDLTLRVVVLNPGPGTFTTTCTGPVPLPPNQGFYFVLGSRLTADSNLTFSCTLTTGSGDQATDSLVVYKAAQSRPRVRAAVRSITVRPIYGEQFFRFEAIPELSSCGSRTILTYSWTCAFSTVALTGTPYYGFTTSNVPSGTTQCGVQVCVSGTTKCATATFSVTRVASALRANIFGPTTVPEDFGTITLDTVYSDPDNRTLAATDFTWTWTCSNAETGVACTNTATGAALALSSFRNRVTLNAANLETLANLEFTLVLSRGTRSVTTTWTLFVEEAPPEPLPTFQVKVARFSAFVRAEAVVFVPNGGSFADVQNYDFAWSIVELPELTSTSRFSWFLPLGELRDALQTSSSSGNTSSVVDQVVRPSMPATQLTFRVTVTNSEGGSRSGDVEFSTDGPPRGCSVDIINLEEAAAGNDTTGGTAFETDFSIETTGCTVDGSNNDIRRYAFYHTRDGERPLLIGTSSSNAVTRKLPAGHEADSKLTIIVVVRDQLGAEAGFTAQITVNPPADTLSAAQTAVENLASEASLTRSVDDVVEQASTAMSVLALLDDSCDSGCDEAAVAQTKADLASSVISTLTTFADNFEPNEVDGYCLDSASTGDSAAQSALEFFKNSFGGGDFGSMDLSADGSFAQLLQIWLDLAASVAKRTKAMHEHKRLNKMTIRVTAEQETANNNLEDTLNLLDQSFVDTLGDDTDNPVGTSGSTTTTSLVGRYSRIGQQRGVDTTATFVVDSKTTTIAFTSVDQTASASWTDIDVRTFVMSPNSLVDETTPTDEAADVAAIYRLKAAPINGQGSLPALVLNMDTPVRFTFETGTACTTTGRVCECQIWDQTTNQWGNDTRLTAETSGTSLVCSLDLSASDTEAHDFIVAPFSKADSSGGDDDAEESSTDNLPVIAGAAGAVVLLLAVGIYCCCCKSDKKVRSKSVMETQRHNERDVEMPQQRHSGPPQSGYNTAPAPQGEGAITYRPGTGEA